jgi:hypothetical protein
MTRRESAWRKAALCAGFFVCLAYEARPASAQQPAPAAAPAATAHDEAIAKFEAARALIKSGDCAGAIPVLKEALTLEPLVGAHLNLAECYQKTDPLAAWRELKEAEFLTYTRGDDRTKVAHERAAALEPQLALVRVVISPEVLQRPGLEVKLDGIVIDRFYYQGGVIAVNPGAHTFEVRAPGKRFSGSTSAAPGSTAEVVVTLTDAPKETVVGPPPRVVFGASPGRRTAGLVTGSVGLAGVVLGAVSGAVSLYYASDVKKECGPNLAACPNPLARPDANTANRFAVVSDVGLFGGGALVVAGVGLYFTAPIVPLGAPGADRKPGAASRSWLSGVSLVPVVGPGAASLAAVGSF